MAPGACFANQGFVNREMWIFSHLHRLQNYLQEPSISNLRKKPENFQSLLNHVTEYYRAFRTTHERRLCLLECLTW